MNIIKKREKCKDNLIKIYRRFWGGYIIIPSEFEIDGRVV
jgi:hypothetical protein